MAANASATDGNAVALPAAAVVRATIGAATLGDEWAVAGVTAGDGVEKGFGSAADTEDATSGSVGAATGGLLGGVSAAGSNAAASRDYRDWERREATSYAAKRGQYNRAFAACMEGRGYTVK